MASHKEEEFEPRHGVHKISLTRIQGAPANGSAIGGAGPREASQGVGPTKRKVRKLAQGTRVGQVLVPCDLWWPWARRNQPGDHQPTRQIQHSMQEAQHASPAALPSSPRSLTAQSTQRRQARERGRGKTQQARVTCARISLPPLLHPHLARLARLFLSLLAVLVRPCEPTGDINARARSPWLLLSSRCGRLFSASSASRLAAFPCTGGPCPTRFLVSLPITHTLKELFERSTGSLAGRGSSP